MNRISTNITGDRGCIDTGNSVLNGILNIKASEAVHKEIHMEITTVVPTVMDIEAGDLTELTQKLLDQAIKSVLHLNAEKRKIDLRLEFDRGRLFFRLFFAMEKQDAACLEDWTRSVKKLIGHYHGTIDVEKMNRKGVYQVFIMLYCHTGKSTG